MSELLQGIENSATEDLDSLAAGCLPVHPKEITRFLTEKGKCYRRYPSRTRKPEASQGERFASQDCAMDQAFTWLKLHIRPGRDLDMANEKMTMERIFKKNTLGSEDEEYIYGKVKEISRKILPGYRLINQADWDDVIQIASKNVFAHRLVARNHPNIPAWITTVCRNVANDFHNIRTEIQENEISDVIRPPSGDSGADVLTIERSVPAENIEDRLQLNKAFEALNEEMGYIYRDVMVLSDVEGMSSQEIGRKLYLTETNVNVIKFRAKQFLKYYINKHGGR